MAWLHCCSTCLRTRSQKYAVSALTGLSSLCKLWLWLHDCGIDTCCCNPDFSITLINCDDQLRGFMQHTGMCASPYHQKQSIPNGLTAAFVWPAAQHAYYQSVFPHMAKGGSLSVVCTKGSIKAEYQPLSKASQHCSHGCSSLLLHKASIFTLPATPLRVCSSSFRQHSLDYPVCTRRLPLLPAQHQGHHRVLAR